MIAVPTFQAYALTRPQGWPAGLYDGTFGEDGLRLFRDGVEVLHRIPGTTDVRAYGACLILAVPGGELELELRPPAPADPRGTALAIELYLTGRKVKSKWVRTDPPRPSGWLLPLAFLPFVFDVILMLMGGGWLAHLCGLIGGLNLLLCFGKGRSPSGLFVLVGFTTGGASLVFLVGVLWRVLKL